MKNITIHRPPPPLQAESFSSKNQAISRNYCTLSGDPSGCSMVGGESMAICETIEINSKIPSPKYSLTWRELTLVMSETVLE